MVQNSINAPNLVRKMHVWKSWWSQLLNKPIWEEGGWPGYINQFGHTQKIKIFHVLFDGLTRVCCLKLICDWRLEREWVPQWRAESQRQRDSRWADREKADADRGERRAGEKVLQTRLASSWQKNLNFSGPRRFRLPSLHILHMRCKFCVIRAVGRNLQFLHVWVRLREKSIVHRDCRAQERAQEKSERNRRWFERKKSTFLVRAANAPVRAANAPYGELHTSTNSRSSEHECGEHTTRRLWSGRGLGQSRTNLRRSKALRWSVRLPIVDTSFCSGPNSADIVKTSLLERGEDVSTREMNCQLQTYYRKRLFLFPRRTK